MILQHPKFPIASRHYFKGITTWRRTLGLANRFSSTEVATHIIYYVMLLHYGNPTGAPEAGATFGRLLDICETRKQCGARALRTVLVLANLAGYLHAARSSTDRRVQYYVPSPKLLQMVREFHRRALSCLDHLVAQPIYEQMTDAGSEVSEHILATAGREVVSQGIPIVEYIPDLHHLMQLAGGCPTVLAIVYALECGAPLPSTYQIAREYGISASQARNILQVATGHGLVQVNESGQPVEANGLRQASRTLLARELALYAKYTFGLEPYFVAGPATVAFT